MPRQRRGVEKRARIYREALRHFAERGVEDSRVEEIVAAADVSWGSFFRYFPRKEDVLLQAGVEHYRAHVLPRVETVGGDPAAGARAASLSLFEAILTPVDLSPAVHGAVLRELVDNPPRFLAMLGEGEEPLVLLIARILERGREAGEVRDDVDVVTLAGVLTAAVMFTTVRGYYGDPAGLRGQDTSAGPEELVRRTFAVAWRGLEPL